MENYTRGRQEEDVIDKDKITIPNLPQDFTWIQVSDGSKIRNLVRCAEQTLQQQRVVVWTGVGKSLGKAISCAEILRRKFTAHQITRIAYCAVHEHWDPKVPYLEPLVVERSIPVIHILVSRQSLDVTDVGYQGPGKKETFFHEEESGRSSKGRSTSKHSKQTAARAAMLKQMTSQSHSSSQGSQDQS